MTSRLRTSLLAAAMLAAGLIAGTLVLRLVPPRRGGGPALLSAPAPSGPAPAAAGPVELEPAWPARLGARPVFSDVTAAAGIDFVHTNGLSGDYHYLEMMGAGVAFFDYDGDGWLDLYFVNGNRLRDEPDPAVTNRLYRNRGDGTFVDVTAQAGVGDPGYGQGCCAGDFDSDGDQDLYVTNYGPNVFYRNNGDGTFSDIADAAGVQDTLWGQTCAFLDYDNDGWLDLYVQNYLTYSLDLGYEAFVYVGDRKYRDYASPHAFPGAPDRLFRNRGDGTFEDVTSRAGVLRPGGKGMGLATVDLDDDGYVDIYVSNDSMENYLFVNRGDGTFDERGMLAGVAFDAGGEAESSMGVGFGDLNGDSRIDLVVPNIWQQVFALYQNEGGRFIDVSWQAGLGQPTGTMTGFSPSLLDYDSDGDLDLFFTTGGVRAKELALAEADFVRRYGLPDLLLANDGEGRFVNVSRWAGAHFAREWVGRASATGDYDNDGDLDLALTNLNGPAVLLRNDTEGGHWIAISLAPRRGAPDGLGAKVWIEAGGRRQRAVVAGSGSYLSQSERRVHFGLGGATRIDRLEVLWPSGAREVREGVAPVDRFLTFEEAAAPRSSSVGSQTQVGDATKLIVIRGSVSHLRDPVERALAEAGGPFAGTRRC